MAEQPVIIQKISWADLCPWTIIFRTLPVASSVTVLCLALLGVVLTPAGWLLSESIFVNSELRKDAEFVQFAEKNRSPHRGLFEATERNADSINLYGLHLSGPRLVFQGVVSPFQKLFNRDWGLRHFFYILLGCISSICIWTFVGLGIARVSLLRLTRNEQSGLDDAFEYAMDHWKTAVSAVSIPLIGVALLCIPAFIIGLMMGFDIGVLVVGVCWFLTLGLAIAMGLLLIGLMFGWPLMVASVGCEGQNAFDAMTRSYAYVFQRPMHYAFYMLVAIVFGGLCWLFAHGLTNAVVDLSFWSTSWGAGQRVNEIQGVLDGAIVPSEDAPASSALNAGRSMIGLWNSMLRTLAAAFIHGLFWCMAAAIYLLLRKDVDETEMDEIFLASEQRTYELPPLESDERGIPVVQKPRAVDEEEPSEDSETTDGRESNE